MQQINGNPTNSLAALATPPPSLPALTTGRLKILVGIVTQMWLCCAPAQLPDSAGIVTMARAWAHVVPTIPDEYLQAAYERAIAAHAASPRRTFPMGVTDIAHAWLELGEELAYARSMQPASQTPQLPSPQAKPLTESNTLPGVLTELAQAWGEWSGGERGKVGVTLYKVLEWASLLGKAYPDIPPASMRLQLQKMRLAGATSLGAAVQMLLTKAAPAPTEGEAI
jgi:hypothetical protein